MKALALKSSALMPQTSLRAWMQNSVWMKLKIATEAHAILCYPREMD